MKNLLLFCLCILCIIFIKNKLFFFGNKYFFVHDSVLAQETCSNIENFFYRLDQKSSDTSLINGIREKFPFVHKVVIEHFPLYSLMRLDVDKPCCCINDDVFTQSRKLYSRTIFSHNIVENIPFFSSNDTQNIFSLVPSFLHNMPSDFNQTYDVMIKNEHFVVVTDKNNKNFSIVCLMNQSNLSEIFTQCKKAYQAVAKNFKTSDEAWITDVRFHDYIIVYKDKKRGL